MGKQNKTIRNKRKIKIENYDSNHNNKNSLDKKITKAFSREAKITIVSIFLVTVIMISSAYAIFSTVQKQELYNTLSVGTLKIDFDATSTDMGNIINLNGAYPISDDEGQKTNPYKFKITNSGTLDAKYKIKIIDDADMIKEDKCENILLPKDKIKVSINGNKAVLLSELAANSYTVEENFLKPNKNKSFQIRIWIDEKSGNEVLNKHYHGKIIIESESTTIKPKEPTNKNVTAAYLYNNTDEAKKCIQGNEATCEPTACYKSMDEDSCKAGTIIKYKVNENEEKTFNVLHDDGETLVMQHQESTISNTPWHSTPTPPIANTQGPTVALPRLEEATSGWINVDMLEYEMGKTNFNNTNAYTGCSPSESICNVNLYTLPVRKARARMIMFQEAQTLGCNYTIGKSCPSWLTNNISNCKNYGKCDYTGSNNGYWTMNADTAYNFAAYYMESSGNFLSTSVSTNVDVRAVVQITK